MSETPTMSPAGRATAEFVAEPAPKLLCSHCGGELTDDDADCPTCTTPIDWGASRAALQAWSDRGAD
jgi:predicted amidophosphoribosyltransferase